MALLLYAYSQGVCTPRVGLRAAARGGATTQSRGSALAMGIT
jgi:hypothetical protein